MGEIWEACDRHTGAIGPEWAKVGQSFPAFGRLSLGFRQC